MAGLNFLIKILKMVFISSFVLLFAFRFKSKQTKQQNQKRAIEIKRSEIKVKSDLNKKSELKLGGMRLIEED